MKFVLQTVAVVLVGLVGHGLLSFPVTDRFRVGLPRQTELLSAVYAETKKPVAVDWQTLGELDFRTGNKTPAVTQLVDDGVAVRVPGFIRNPSWRLPASAGRGNEGWPVGQQSFIDYG